MVEINVARLIGATEECACGLSGSQPARRAMRICLSFVKTFGNDRSAIFDNQSCTFETRVTRDVVLLKDASILCSCTAIFLYFRYINCYFMKNTIFKFFFVCKENHLS